MRFLKLNLFRWMMALAIQIASISFSSGVQAEKIVFVNDSSPYCPFTLCGQGKDGFVLDIVNAIYQAKGFTVVIKNVPWNRALSMASDGEVDGILGTAKSSAPNLIYPKTEVGQLKAAFFTLKTNPWTYQDIKSLDAVHLGLIQGYGYGDTNPELANYLNTHSAQIDWIATSDALSHLLMMMEARHVGATIEDETVATYVLRAVGKQALFKVAGHYAHNTVKAYVGFNPKHANARQLAQLFDDGMVDLRRSGKLAAILARYGVSDWRLGAAR